MTNHDSLISPEQYQPEDGFDPKHQAEQWLVLYEGQLVYSSKDQILWSSIKALSPQTITEKIVTGQYKSRYVGIIKISELPQGYQSLPIREALTQVNTGLFTCISHSLQIQQSRIDHAFCGCCGHAMTPKEGEWSMVCVNCNTLSYPIISPCIIVAITKGESILLVRHIRHGKASTIHTLIAGFVEPGESVEQAVHREVLEETGLKVKNLKYCFSQSWPFPHSLMLGYTAEYDSGILTLDKHELFDGGWFNRKELPDIPAEFTISRQIINSLI